MWCKDYSMQDKNRMVTSEINDRKNEGIKLVHGVLTRIKKTNTLVEYNPYEEGKLDRTCYENKKH